MTNKTIKSAVAALALVVLATSGGTASAGVASITLGNTSSVVVQAGETGTATTKVGYRRHRGHHKYGFRHHRRHGWNHGYRYRGHGYKCRVKKRFWDGYGYYYRYVNICRY